MVHVVKMKYTAWIWEAHRSSQDRLLQSFKNVSLVLQLVWTQIWHWTFLTFLWRMHQQRCCCANFPLGLVHPEKAPHKSQNRSWNSGKTLFWGDLWGAFLVNQPKWRFAMLLGPWCLSTAPQMFPNKKLAHLEVDLQKRLTAWHAVPWGSQHPVNLAIGICMAMCLMNLHRTIHKLSTDRSNTMLPQKGF